MQAVHGAKATGRDFHNDLRECIDFLDFKPYLADPDISMCEAKKSDGIKY